MYGVEMVLKEFHTENMKIIFIISFLYTLFIPYKPYNPTPQ